jgi:ABC-type transporter Mla subunit MlaD
VIPGGEQGAQQRVGAAMMGVILAAGVFVVVVLPRLDFGGGVRVKVTFGHSGSLREGAPLIVAGRTAGKVESIALDASQNGGGSIVTVRVDDEYVHMVPIDGDFFISSKGVLSARYLEVGPHPGRHADPGRPVREGDVIVGIDPPSLDSALNRTWANLEKSREFLQAVDPEVAELKTSLAGLAKTIEEVEPSQGAYAKLAVELAQLWKESRELQETLESAGATPGDVRELAKRAGATIDHARAAVARVRAAADELMKDLERVRGEAAKAAPGAIERLRGALKDADALMAKVDTLLAGARELAAIIERGEGSAIKLSRDPEFPEDAKELGKMLKRSPWRIIGHPDDHSGLPPRAPTRERGTTPQVPSP